MYINSRFCCILCEQVVKLPLESLVVLYSSVTSVFKKLTRVFSETGILGLIIDHTFTSASRNME